MRRLGGQALSSVDRVIRSLPPTASDRIKVQSWSDYSDAAYAHLGRAVRSAAAFIPQFRESVHNAATRHVGKLKFGEPREQAFVAASVEYILDEIAMCLRITEIAGFSSEYYPAEDLTVLTELYGDAFAEEGLTVKELTGSPPRRSFTKLP